MKNNKNPATSGGAQVVENTTTIAPTGDTAKDSIWDACREALDAELYREEYAAAKLEKAATQLGGFTKNGRDWTQQCPHCNFIVRLITEDSGIRAVSSGNCDAVPAINQWLRDEGYAS